MDKLFNRILFLFRKKKAEPDPMKYLIVGLGNMDIEYDGTRHNVGFEVIDAVINEKELPVKNERLGDLAVVKHRGRTLYLLKPSTYMNRSGKAVQYWLQKLNIDQKNLLVIVDDLNIDFGRIRIRAKGSDGGHNGLRDIQQYIGTEYARIRIGIGDAFHQGQQVNYVLGKWSAEEKKILPEIIKKCTRALFDFSFRGIHQTMNTYNK
jgi:PTH1 family peptidyl-tRNA hydrolase